MPMQTLHDLFIEQLNELFAGEAASIQAMQALRRAASNPRLAKLLEAHERESEKHAARLEDIFDSLEVVPRRAGSHTLKGLCDDCVEWAGMSGAEPHVRDAALIAAAQHLEHDEIAGYGCARTWASSGCQAAKNCCSAGREALSSSIWARSTLARRCSDMGTAG